jgi:hypothetical protein
VRVKKAEPGKGKLCRVFICSVEAFGCCCPEAIGWLCYVIIVLYSWRLLGRMNWDNSSFVVAKNVASGISIWIQVTMVTFVSPDTKFSVKTILKC